MPAVAPDALLSEPLASPVLVHDLPEAKSSLLLVDQFRGGTGFDSGHDVLFLVGCLHCCSPCFRRALLLLLLSLLGFEGCLARLAVPGEVRCQDLAATCLASLQVPGGGGCFLNLAWTVLLVDSPVVFFLDCPCLQRLSSSQGREEVAPATS